MATRGNSRRAAGVARDELGAVEIDVKVRIEAVRAVVPSRGVSLKNRAQECSANFRLPLFGMFPPLLLRRPENLAFNSKDRHWRKFGMPKSALRK